MFYTELKSNRVWRGGEIAVRGRWLQQRSHVAIMALWQKDILRYQLRDACLYWVVIPAGVLGSGWLLDYLWHWPRLPSGSYLVAVSLGLVTLGCIMITAAMRAFSRFGRGTANPRQPPVVLVQQSVYSLCRHPMFLGYDLAALGVILMSRSPGALLISFPGFIFGQILFLRKEERFLARRFRQDFAVYQRRVPFLFPTRIPRRRS